MWGSVNYWLTGWSLSLNWSWLLQAMTSSLSPRFFNTSATTSVLVTTRLANAFEILSSCFFSGLISCLSDAFEYAMGLSCWILASNVVIVRNARIFCGMSHGELHVSLASRVPALDVSLSSMDDALWSNPNMIVQDDGGWTGSTYSRQNPDNDGVRQIRID